MTTTIKQCKSDPYYVSLEVTKNRCGNGIYVVQVCPCIDECRCGYPEREMTYAIQDKEKAYATYRRYVRKYCKENK